MNILFIQNHRRNPNAGAPGGLLRLGAEFEKMGHTTDYVFADDVPKFTSKFRINGIIFPYLVPQIVHKMQSLRKYDIINISSGDGWVLGLCNKLFRIKRSYVQIMRSHGLEHLDYLCSWLEEVKRGHTHLSLRFRLWFRYIRLNEVKSAIKLANHVICLSSPDKEYITQMKWKLDKDISVIGNGLTQGFFVDRIYQTPGTRLLFVSTWIPRKGIFYLVEAFVKILKSIPDVTLSVVGAGRPRGQVLSSFPQETRSRIRVIPFVEHEKLVGEYIGHSILMYPTLFEGFGNVLLEAMATGMPIIATRTGAMCDVIQDGVNGVIIPKRDSEALAQETVKLIRNRQLRERIGKHARETARDYTWEKVAKRTLKIYEKLIAETQSLRK